MTDTIVRARMCSPSRPGLAAARTIYDSYAERLKRDMQVEPEPATQALLRELLPARSPRPVLPPRLRARPARRCKSVPKVLILRGAKPGAGRTETEILGMSLVDE